MDKYVDKSILAKVFRKREKWAHKGDYGYVMILSGSAEFAGTAALNAVAAQRCGADLVYVVAPERAAYTAINFSPSLVTIPLPGKYFALKHVRKALAIAQKANVVSIGSGLGEERETRKAVLSFMEKVGKPLVVDALAIRAMEGLKLKTKRRLLHRCIITPHSDEFRSLTGESVTSHNVRERVEKAKGWARRLGGCVILLKGAVDVITDGERVMLNKTGNPFMSVAGTGDLLAGLCAGIVGQHNALFESACAAAYLNGRAGDIAARGIRRGMKAEDILAAFDKALRG